jgi:uncharacterized protein (TIGR03437 family)
MVDWRLVRLVLGTGLFLGGAQSQAEGEKPPASSELLLNANGANDAYAGVGRFRAALTCTGSLIDPADTGASDSRAWLLTAGHCISFEPYGVIRNQPSTARVEFHSFLDTPERRVTVRARAVGWSTMKGVDLALVELDATLGELRGWGVRPVQLAARAPEAGQPVFWTGISGSPIPAELQFLRRGRCTLGPPAQLLEGSWIWNDVRSNDCPDLYAGASGSPLFDAASGEAIGVIGTSTVLSFEHGPDYDCQLNRPCVLRTGGPAVEENTSYAAPIAGIAQCFDRNNNLEIERPGCPLDPGYQLTVRSGSNEVRPEADGKPAVWDAALSGSQRYYAYKHFLAGADDCGRLQGYSAPIPVTAAPVIRDPIGPADGYYLLCVIAGETPMVNAVWQRASHASVRFKRIDSQPPAVEVDYEIETLVNGWRLNNFTGGDGPSGLGPATHKRGPPAQTDCQDPREYRIQTSIPEIVRTSDLPTRICWKYSDRAGNFGNPVIFDFGSPAMLPNAMRNGASLERGNVAAGSAIRVDTFNLTDTVEYSMVPAATLAGVRMFVLDSAGRTLPVPMTTAGPLFVEGVLPQATSPGPATAILQPPSGPSIFQAIRIGGTAPGIYTDTATGGPHGFASNSDGDVFPLASCHNQGCFITHLPLSSTPGGLTLVLYGTGLRGLSGGVRLSIGTHTVDRVDVRPHSSFAGVDEVRFDLPREFPLRLYQVVSAETPDGASNPVWIYLE